MTLTEFSVEDKETTEPSSRISRFTGSIVTSKYELAAFIFLCTFAIAIAWFKLDQAYSSSSLEWDSGSFLTNGAIYAGFSQYSQALDPTRPPVIPFLLSLAFRVTGPLAIDGYVLSAAFYVIAMAGAFLIAKEMMNPVFAAIASLSYGLAPYVFQWSGIMLSDVEGVGLASLALAFLIIAAKRNKKLLLIALPLFMLTPLTRYSLGLIIIVGVVYLLAARKNDWILDHFEFYYGFGLSLLVFAIFGAQWLSYPFINHTTIGILFPKADAVNPFHSVLGPKFYAANFANELGSGMYGEFLAAISILTTMYAIIQLARKRLSNVNPIAFAMMAWLFLMLTYYSVGWPYADLRYSVEFVMPAIILAFYGISLAAERLGSRMPNLTARRSIRAGTLVVTILLSFTVGIMFYGSGTHVATTTAPMESDLNIGLKYAVGWLHQYAPSNAKIETNWFTLLWWYAPSYNITAAPLDYQLQAPSYYSSWTSLLISNHISYVVYVDPSPQLEQQMTVLHPSFNYTSGSTEVMVYSVY